MEEITRLIARIEPERKIRHALLALPELRLALSRLPAAARPSAVVEALDRIPEPTLAAWAASFPTTHDGRRVRAYLAEWRHVRSELDGRALMAMGMPAGPAIGETLRLLRAARLDGRVVSLDDERRLVKNTLLKHRPPEE
jgi:tRNA nucleotidyltransferase (CCA-adding enzyme)